jgi:U3 small nucleolar RNA-associated protein 18
MPLALFSIDDSKMYIWDVGTRRCEHTFEDEGCIHSDSMAIAPNGSYFAAGYVSVRYSWSGVR